jgi:3-deoxy-D-manno-octulosonic-acid transferase
MDLPERAGGPLIHFHAASVGEISSLAPVVREVSREVPGYGLLVTTMTPTGRDRAAALITGADVRLVPYDFRSAMRRFMNRMRPSVIVVTETELWPNLLREASRLEIPLVLVNGRISVKSIGRYRRVGALVRSMLSQFDLMLMRSDEDAGRALSLGADPDRVRVVGNTKYDVLAGPVPAEQRRALRKRLGISDAAPVVMLGSARQGESEILLEAIRAESMETLPTVILAPRHLENVRLIEAVCRRSGYGVALSAGAGESGRAPEAGEAGGAGRAIIVNEMGRLLEYYAISDIGVVGGTFKPHGGHNPLEPASQGAVVVVGPHRDNIADDMDYLISRDAAVITDEPGLGAVIRGLLFDPARMSALAERAAGAVQDKKGASRRSIEAMKARGLLG